MGKKRYKPYKATDYKASAEKKEELKKIKPEPLAIRTHLTDEEFFSILRINLGLYARTAFAIEQKYNIKYSRQAVRDRALNNPEELLDIKEQNIDVAEDGLFTLIRSKNERVRFRAIELYLKTQGRGRGYIQKTEIDLTAKPEYDLKKLSNEQLIQWIELQQILIGPGQGPEQEQKSIE